MSNIGDFSRWRYNISCNHASKWHQKIFLIIILEVRKSSDDVISLQHQLSLSTQEGRLLSNSIFILSTKQMNRITKKSSSKLVMQPSSRTSQIHETGLKLVWLVASSDGVYLFGWWIVMPIRNCYFQEIVYWNHVCRLPSHICATRIPYPPSPPKKKNYNNNNILICKVKWLKTPQDLPILFLLQQE